MFKNLDFTIKPEKLDRPVKTSAILILVATLVTYMCQSLTNGTYAATTLVAESFPGISLTTVTLVSSVPMLTAIPTNLLCGMVINKLGFKKTLFLGYIIFFTGGLLPFFYCDSFWFILVCRGIVGLALGLFMPMPAILVSHLYDGQTRATVMGWGATFNGVAGTLCTQVGGFFAARSLRELFLYHLIALIPFIFALFIPKFTPKAANTGTEKADTGAKSKWSGRIWYFTLVNAVAFCFMYPVLIYTASIVIEEGLGTAALGGTIVSSFNMAGMVIGLFIGTIYGKIGKYSIPAGLLFIGAGFTSIVFHTGTGMLFLGVILIGIGYHIFYASAFTALSVVADPTVYGTAMGINYALSTGASVVSPFIVSFIGGLFGQAQSIYSPMVIGMVFFWIVGLIFAVKPVKIISYLGN
ncbi:MAG: MFS transporter [Lachnospiraceae bacterium]|nr:MFS transporter [Lachnospiraceae bacterium]